MSKILAHWLILEIVHINTVDTASYSSSICVSRFHFPCEEDELWRLKVYRDVHQLNSEIQ